MNQIDNGQAAFSLKTVPQRGGQGLADRFGNREHGGFDCLKGPGLVGLIQIGRRKIFGDKIVDAIRVAVVMPMIENDPQHDPLEDHLPIKKGPVDPGQRVGFKPRRFPFTFPTLIPAILITAHRPELDVHQFAEAFNTTVRLQDRLLSPSTQAIASLSPNRLIVGFNILDTARSRAPPNISCQVLTEYP